MSVSPAKKEKLAEGFLEPGQRGFLITCKTRKEDCIPEAYSLLNEYADKLYGKENSIENVDPEKKEKREDEEEGDIADDLEGDIAAAAEGTDSGNRSKTRFQSVDTGVDYCIFISTTLSNPIQLATYIFKDLANAPLPKTRFLRYCVPVEVVCNANKADIKTETGLLIAKHFKPDSFLFSIVFNGGDDTVYMDDLLNLLVSKKIEIRPTFKQRGKILFLEIVKDLCCLSVVDDYFEFEEFDLEPFSRAEKRVVDKMLKDEEAANRDNNSNRKPLKEVQKQLKDEGATKSTSDSIVKPLEVAEGDKKQLKENRGTESSSDSSGKPQEVKKGEEGDDKQDDDG